MPPGFVVKRLDHVGIAARSRDEANALFTHLLGLPLQHEEALPGQGVDALFYPAGDVKLEVLLDDGTGGPIGRFLDKDGPGIHHVAFEVDDIEKALAELKAKGVRLVDDKPRRGALGKRIAFVHPKSTMGVLVELVERR